MAGVDAREEKFEIMELFGMKVLYTCLRVDRKTIPSSLFAYDCRHDDDSTGELCEIKPYIMVNHWGTIICKEPIDLIDDGCRLVSEEDYSYTGEVTTLSDFVSS